MTHHLLIKLQHNVRKQVLNWNIVFFKHGLLLLFYKTHSLLLYYLIFLRSWKNKKIMFIFPHFSHSQKGGVHILRLASKCLLKILIDLNFNCLKKSRTITVKLISRTAMLFFACLLRVEQLLHFQKPFLNFKICDYRFNKALTSVSCLIFMLTKFYNFTILSTM